ncbi:anti sigma factor C-terminal domain-containing protein [Paenibacillus rhizoplanae]
MVFYHPEIQYDSYEDSIRLLKQLGDDTLVELALSFDHAYTLDETQKLLPAGVQPVWFWADAYTPSYKKIPERNAPDHRSRFDDHLRIPWRAVCSLRRCRLLH